MAGNMRDAIEGRKRLSVSVSRGRNALLAAGKKIVRLYEAAGEDEESQERFYEAIQQLKFVIEVVSP